MCAPVSASVRRRLEARLLRRRDGVDRAKGSAMFSGTDAHGLRTGVSVSIVASLGPYGRLTDSFGVGDGAPRAVYFQGEGTALASVTHSNGSASTRQSHYTLSRDASVANMPALASSIGPSPGR